MSGSRTVLALAATAVGVISVVATASPASAEAPANGCPPGYALMWVDVLASQGYRVPGIVDDPANTYGFGHLPGNGDGRVCGRLVGKSDNGLPLYEFFDNTLPASG